MRKSRLLSTIFLLMLLGCQNMNKNALHPIDEVVFTITPIFDPERILSGTEALKELLIAKMADRGFEIDEVIINISTNQQAAAEALTSGASHLAYFSALTAESFKNEGIEALLIGERGTLSAHGQDLYTWNHSGPITRDYEQLSTYYEATIIAGPSAYGKILQAKADQNEPIVWEDLEQAKWCISNSTTSAGGYIYPSLWLYDNFKKTYNDVDVALQVTTNPEVLLGLATMDCDVGAQYAFIRSDFADEWVEVWGRSESVWEETRVIGVSKPILNSVIYIAIQHKDYSETFRDALQSSLDEIVDTEAGQGIFNTLNLNGLAIPQEKDFDSTKAAYQLIKEQFE